MSSHRSTKTKVSLFKDLDADIDSKAKKETKIKKRGDADLEVQNNMVLLVGLLWVHSTEYNERSKKCRNMVPSPKNQKRLIKKAAKILMKVYKHDRDIAGYPEENVKYQLQFVSKYIDDPVLHDCWECMDEYTHVNSESESESEESECSDSGSEESECRDIVREDQVRHDAYTEVIQKMLLLARCLWVHSTEYNGRSKKHKSIEPSPKNQKRLVKKAAMTMKKFYKYDRDAIGACADYTKYQLIFVQKYIDRPVLHDCWDCMDQYLDVNSESESGSEESECVNERERAREDYTKYQPMFAQEFIDNPVLDECWGYMNSV